MVLEEKFDIEVSLFSLPSIFSSISDLSRSRIAMAVMRGPGSAGNIPHGGLGPGCGYWRADIGFLASLS